MIAAALKLIKSLSNEPKNAALCSELMSEILNSEQLPEVAYAAYCDDATPSRRVEEVGIAQVMETLETSLITSLLRRFPESAVNVVVGNYSINGHAWKTLQRYAKEQLFGVWELASGQPMPKRSMILVDRQDLIKQLLDIESAILNALEDELSEENEERLQRAFRRLVEMRIKK